jgi:single-strand DNA-binding protein
MSVRYNTTSESPLEHDTTQTPAARRHSTKGTHVSKDLNKILIIGRLGSDPEMRFIGQGTPVTTLRVAAGRSWKDANGATREETEWFRVVAWNKLAEVCNNYLSKGARVYIEGRLQTRTWQDKETGQVRSTVEVIVSDLIMLEGRKAAPAESLDPEEEPRTAPGTRPTRQAAAASPARASSGRGANVRASKAAPGRDRAPRGAFPEEDLPF